MSLWKRFTRALKGMAGGVVESIEDPKLVLEQNIRELNDQVPKMNQNIAIVKANVIQLEKQQKSTQTQYDTLVANIKAAINQGRDDIAANYALQLETTERNLNEINQDLAVARQAYEKALEVKKAFMAERERKIKEAQEAIRAYDRSKAQAKVADAMESFEVGGLDQTHDEMMAKLNERTARNEARVEMAVDSVDTTKLKIEEEARQLRAQDLVAKFKMEMQGAKAPAEQESSGTVNVENKDSVL